MAILLYLCVILLANQNPIFDEIKEAVETLIPKSVASTNEDVSANKENRLTRMDEAGVNDGKVINNEVVIDDEISEKEKDIAAVVAALKTIEVLGEILQNYPTGIDGKRKIEMSLLAHYKTDITLEYSRFRCKDCCSIFSDDSSLTDTGETISTLPNCSFILP